MARYRTTIHTPRSQGEAFAYMADVTNFAAWDPGVTDAVLVTGDGPGPGSEFDVTIEAPLRDITLRYVTTKYDEPSSLVLRARHPLFTSLDRIEVVPDGDGSIVTYDAELTLHGPLRVADVVLRAVFDRIGRRADEGLQQALDGVPAAAHA